VGDGPQRASFVHKTVRFRSGLAVGKRSEIRAVVSPDADPASNTHERTQSRWLTVTA
jgi:hypothetical protein